MAEPVELFLKIGMHKRIAEETIANSFLTAQLVAIIKEAGVTNGCERSMGYLLYMVASKTYGYLGYRSMLLKYILSSKIKTPAQLHAAFKYLNRIPPYDLDISKFEDACGVGVEVSREDVENAVDEIMNSKFWYIWDHGYYADVGDVYAYVLKKHPWADPKLIRELIDFKLCLILEPRTRDDYDMPVKKKKDKPPRERKNARK